MYTGTVYSNETKKLQVYYVQRTHLTPPLFLKLFLKVSLKKKTYFVSISVKTKIYWGVTLSHRYDTGCTISGYRNPEVTMQAVMKSKL